MKSTIGKHIIKIFLTLGLFFSINQIQAQGWVSEILKQESPQYAQFNSFAAMPDSGFFAVGNINKSTTDICDDTTCFYKGVQIVRYNKLGNVILDTTYFYALQNLLQVQVIGTGIFNCKDNSGLIVQYKLEQFDGTVNNNYWLEIATKYAKINYNGTVINGDISIDALGYYANSSINHRYENTNQPEFIEFVFESDTANFYNYNPEIGSVFIKHNVFNNNLNVVSKKIDTLSKIFSIDTTKYKQKYTSIFPVKSLKLDDGGILTPIIGYLRNKITDSIVLIPDSWLLKQDINGEFKWCKKMPVSSPLSTTFMSYNNRNYFIAKDYSTQTVTTKLFSVNENGNLEDSVAINFKSLNLHLRRINNKMQVLLFANGYVDSDNDGIKDDKVFFIEFDEQLTQTKIKEVKMPSYFKDTRWEFSTGTDLVNGSTVFKATYRNQDNFVGFKSVLVNIDSLGNVYNSSISGSVFGDKNNNCTIENTDAFLRNYAVRAISNRDSFYTSTDTLGFFEMSVDTGNYQLQLLPNPSYPLWKLQNCTVPNVLAINLNDVVTANIGLTAIVSCTNMNVEFTAPFLRRCFPNTYYVNYCNNGTVNAANSYVDITLDYFLSFNSSAQAFTSLGNNRYRFNIGDVETGKCGFFKFNVTVNCDSTILGQTHCSEAHIYPDTICSTAIYNGAIIRASATCKSDRVEFKLKNVGSDMQSDRRYIVTQDQVMRQSNVFQIPAGGEKIIEIQLQSPYQNGATYRIEADQPIDFPPFLGDKKVAAFIEGCRTHPDTTFSTGFISQFPLYDGEPYRSIDCQQNRGSYDPNDKSAMPIGIDTDHFIEKNIPITYTIRFQNKGTDTAFRVSVIDSISPYLDINSIQLNNSSHDCRMIRIDTNVIQFLFDPIKLVDSTTNDEASNGFVQFRLQQKSNNTNGTIIYNKASIAFDYNTPIITNTTFHTIDTNFITVDLVSAIKNSVYKNLTISVSPNPFRDKAVLVINGVVIKNPKLILFDLSGNLVNEVFSNQTNNIIIYRNQLNAGMYFFKIFDNQEEVVTGKIIIQ